MKDFSRDLPLSQRERHDETGVTSDWSTLLRSTLLLWSEALDRLDLAAWQSQSLRAAVSVSEAVAEALTVALPRGERAEVRATSSESADDLRAFADHIEASARRTRIGSLTPIVVGALDVAEATRVPILLDPIATGAVAIARSVRAPIGIREVLRDNRFVAVDAEWSVGSGSSVETSAAAIILFLFERIGIPRASAT